MEEERRLAFVAVTRAEKALYLSAAEGRNFDGSPRYPSRFVLDIGEEYLTFTEKPADSLIADARFYIQFSEKSFSFAAGENCLQPGTRVQHDYLGEGEILETDTGKQAYLIKFDEIETPRKISFKVTLKEIP